MSKELGFTAACREFFGQRPAQTLKEFMAEVKELTDDDRAELRPLLEKALSEASGDTVTIK
jgi:hypothetical protein